MRLSLVIVVWLMSGSEALAQPAKAAEDAFDRGRVLMVKKSYAEACAAFELSQRLDPQSGTQFNLAGCYVALDKIAAAWKLYSELAGSDRNAARRTRSAELAAELEDRLPKLRVRIDQQFAGARVLIGEMDMTAHVEDDIPLDEGHYVVAALLPGFRPFHKEIDIESGIDMREVEIVMEPEPIRPSASSARARYSKVALAGGGALVAVGLVAGWRMVANRDELDGAGAPASGGHARVWRDVSVGAFTIGVVGLASGVYLWRTSSPQAVRVGADVTPTSALVVVSGAL